MLAIGRRGMEAGAVSVRLHGKGPQSAKPKAEVVADILADSGTQGVKKSKRGRQLFVVSGVSGSNTSAFCRLG